MTVPHSPPGPAGPDRKARPKSPRAKNERAALGIIKALFQTHKRVRRMAVLANNVVQSAPAHVEETGVKFFLREHPGSVAGEKLCRARGVQSGVRRGGTPRDDISVRPAHARCLVRVSFRAQHPSHAGLWAGLLLGTIGYLYKRDIPLQLKIIQVRKATKRGFPPFLRAEVPLFSPLLTTSPAGPHRGAGRAPGGLQPRGGSPLPGGRARYAQGRRAGGPQHGQSAHVRLARQKTRGRTGARQRGGSDDAIVCTCALSPLSLSLSLSLCPPCSLRVLGVVCRRGEGLPPPVVCRMHAS